MTGMSIRRGASSNTAEIPVRQGGQFAIVPAAAVGSEYAAGRVIVLPTGPSLGGDEAIASVAAIVGGGA